MDPHALFDAASAAPPPSTVDLGGLVATQTRVMRRRRYAAGTGVAGLAVAVAGVSAAPSVLFGGGEGRPATVAGPVTGVDCAETSPAPTPSASGTYWGYGIEETVVGDALTKAVTDARIRIAAQRRMPTPPLGVSTGVEFTSAGRHHVLVVSAEFTRPGSADLTADRIACADSSSRGVSLNYPARSDRTRRERRSLPGGLEAVVYPDGVAFANVVDVVGPDGIWLNLAVYPDDSKPEDKTWTYPTSPASDNPFSTDDLLRAAEAILAP